MTLLGKSNKRWTPEQEALAEELLDAQATPDEFWTKLGRTKASAYTHRSLKKRNTSPTK